MQVHKYHVLVVDKEEEDFQKLIGFLGDTVSFEKVQKPETALVNIQKKYYDAVLCETDFGEISGVDLLKMIRKKYPNYNLLLFTKELSPKNAVEAVESNINGILLKPVSSPAAVESLLGLLRSSKETLKRLDSPEERYRMENNLNMVIPASEEDILNVMNVVDQMTHILYPTNLGNFADLKICVYEALSNAKLHGSPSKSNLISIRAEFKNDRIVCHVKDQGKGFQYAALQGKKPPESTMTGIQLISALMDDVSFNSSGTEINFLKLIKSNPTQKKDCALENEPQN